MSLNRLGRFKPTLSVSRADKLVRGVILAQQGVCWDRCDLAHGLGPARAYRTDVLIYSLLHLNYMFIERSLI